jgi:hypothetical protein
MDSALLHSHDFTWAAANSAGAAQAPKVRSTPHACALLVYAMLEGGQHPEAPKGDAINYLVDSTECTA